MAIDYFPYLTKLLIPPPYSLTDPTIIPVTKYFCRNGYTHIIGKVETIIAADCIDIVVVVVLAPNCWDVALTCVELITSIIR